MIEIQEIKQKNLKELLVSKIIAFELGTTNSHNLAQYICHWQSMYYETPLRFNISLREIFSNSVSPRMVKKYDESDLMPVLQDSGTL